MNFIFTKFNNALKKHSENQKKEIEKAVFKLRYHFFLTLDETQFSKLPAKITKNFKKNLDHTFQRILKNVVHINSLNTMVVII